MAPFKGFTDQETFTQIPDSFLRGLMNDIDDPGELKVTLYALWWVEHMEGRLRFLRREDFAACLPDPAPALEKAVERGSLLRVQSGAEQLYFLNSPRGRAAAESLQKGQWSPSATPSAPPPERPNVFKLYEENIGPLTPMLAEALKDAEQTYPLEWIEQALGEAVKRNKRSWKYVETILRRWKEEGHGEEQDRRDAEKDRRKYIEGEYADYIEH